MFIMLEMRIAQNRNRILSIEVYTLKLTIVFTSVLKNTQSKKAVASLLMANQLIQFFSILVSDAVIKNQENVTQPLTVV